MLHVTLAISEFLLLMLTALATAALSVGGWLVAGGAACWGCWRVWRGRRG